MYWQFFWRMIRLRPWLYLCDALLSVAGWTLFLFPGLILQAFFGTLSQRTSLDQELWKLIALLLVVQAVRMGANLSAIIVDTTFSQTVSALIRINIFSNILRHPGARALPDSPGEAISRFREDVDETVEFLGMEQALALLGASVFASIALVIMLRINVLLTCLVFVPLSSVVVAAQMASTRIKQYHQANREATGRVTSFLGEMFGAVQAVHAANAVHPVIARFQVYNEQRRRAIVRDRVFTQVMNSIFFNAVNLGTGLILLFSAQAIHAGEFTVGDFALFVYFLTWVTQLTKSFGTALAQYRQIGISINRMRALMQDAPPQVLVERSPLYLDGQIPTVPIIAPKSRNDRLETLSVLDLTYHYPGSGRGINAINFVLQRGSFTVITGRIGSGKTCLLRVLLGLLPKEAGEIRWNGHLVEDPASFFVPPRSAYTPQVPRLFSLSLRDNILMGLSEADVDIWAAIHAGVFESDVAAMEQGLDTLVGRKGVRLSGGQIQRTAAARMYVRQPELLIVDDLSSALDVETEHILWQRLRQKEQTTCLAVSHRRAALSRADHIILIKEGHKEGEGTLDSLLDESEEMRALWRESSANE